MSESPLGLFHPYSTSLPLLGGLPTWMDEYDSWRISTYQLYEQIYWNVQDTFSLVARGAENRPIYIPNARTIVDTTNRYVGAGFGWGVDPDFGAVAEQVVARGAFGTLFAREAFRSRFVANKRYGLIRGDWAWHLVADPLKPPGRRISIFALDPASLFKVTHPEDVDRVTAVHIIEQITDPNDDSKTVIKRQTYSKGPDWADPDSDDGRIYSYLAIFDVEAWADPAANPVEVIEPVTPMPPQITALPVYHIRNAEEPGNPWGSSELRGFERIMAAVNQSVSDEELALALEGLGMYATTSGPPQDDDGNDSNWILGPGRVVELSGGDAGQGVDDIFTRINGIGSVAPYQDHLKYLTNALRDAAVLSDAATGKVDVTVAESGIALALQLSPMLSKADERDAGIVDVHSQMFWDLRAWLVAYEGVSMGGAVVMPRLGPKLPENRKAKIGEVLAIAAVPGLVGPEWVLGELTKLGYEFDDQEPNNAIAALQAQALAGDPFAARAAAELDA